MKYIDWPGEDIVLEICWNNDPDRCDVITREFLPERECQYCKKYDCDVCTKNWNNMDKDQYIPERDDKEPNDTCDDWEWDEDLENLRETPLEPKREDYHSERSYKLAVKAVREWWLHYKPKKEDYYE